MTVLRELVRSDAPAIRRVFAGEAVTYLGRPAMTGPEAEEYVARAIAWSAADPAEQFALGAESDCELIGVVRLRLVTPQHGRVGYIFREGSWNRGHATRAVRELVAFAFATLDLTSLGGRHHPGNPASGRVLTKAGFTRTGVVNGMTEYERLRGGEAGVPVGPVPCARK
ncbi:GNAT family N-acetyltransferase [Streptomyces albidoflavus]|uniref:GNAT family N-acetyltransferase n=1 Tax=Streptomyces albidoflavus TaxID=1886 RepID=UPI0033A6A4AD